MRHYRVDKRRGKYRRASQRILGLAIVLALIVVVGSLFVHRSYSSQLKPVSDSTRTVYVTIASGTPPNDIAQLLHDQGLIRSVSAFVWYVTGHNQRDKLQAGTYRLAPNMSTPAIADTIAEGKIATDLVTIVPGQTLVEIRKSFITAGFKVTNVDAALQVDQYRGSPALADNPAASSLEGFLYPDSYQKTANTDPRTVVEEALGEMQKHLTTQVRDGFASQGLTVYQGVTLASIVEREVSKQSDRTQVAQVFLSRLKQNIRLGSDVTVLYARANNDPSYDTTEHLGLPPGPIAAVSDSTLEAVARPAGTSWLYFVTGDDGTTHFAHTLQGHQQNIAAYCHQKCPN